MSKKKPSPEEALVHVLDHRLRKRLLKLCVEAGEELRSPNELTESTDGKISNVAYHVRVLAEYGAVKLIDTRQVRGSVEHFYEATSLVDEVPWGRIALGLAPIPDNDQDDQPSTNKEESA